MAIRNTSYKPAARNCKMSSDLIQLNPQKKCIGVLEYKKEKPVVQYSSFMSI